MPERIVGRFPKVHLVRTGDNRFEVLMSDRYSDGDSSFQTEDPTLALDVFRRARERVGLSPMSSLPTLLAKSEKSL